MEQVMGCPARKVPVITEKAVTRSESLHGGTMWAVMATRVFNKGTRYENTVTVPVFFMDAKAQGITNRAHAREVAGQILGADLPGSVIHYEVHRV